MAHRRPVIGITADLIDHNGLTRAAAPTTYAEAVALAGGLPLILPPIPDLATAMVERCDGLVLTGGDDPIMEPFGAVTDHRVTRVREQRQHAESNILEHLASQRSDIPVLGVCLGMQMMALHAGGALDQFMPDSTPTHLDHWERRHAVVAEPGGWLPSGEVASKHKQAISDPGPLRLLARAHDGVIEAIDDPDRSFYVGVQWHPERSEDPQLGIELFRRLVRSCR